MYFFTGVGTHSLRGDHGIAPGLTHRGDCTLVHTKSVKVCVHERYALVHEELPCSRSRGRVVALQGEDDASKDDAEKQIELKSKEVEIERVPGDFVV